jgi:(4S)-4-hydroxy-5-phosphonooxypentane-2,3-dione isomerase
MYAVIVKIKMMPERREEFIKAMLEDAKGSVQNEADCLLFNIVQDETDINRLCLYEVYRDAEAFEQHKQTPHFTKWLDTVKDWLAEPLDIATGTHLFPVDQVWKKQI